MEIIEEGYEDADPWVLRLIGPVLGMLHENQIGHKVSSRHNAVDCVSALRNDVRRGRKQSTGNGR